MAGVVAGFVPAATRLAALVSAFGVAQGLLGCARGVAVPSAARASRTPEDAVVLPTPVDRVPPVQAAPPASTEPTVAGRARSGSATRSSAASGWRRAKGTNGCSDDMVRVASFCIDRYEIALVDDRTDAQLSPYYPPHAGLIRSIYTEWTDRMVDGTAGLTNWPLPQVPAVELTEGFRPRAVSRAGVAPHGYLSKKFAQTACEAAGKRLCTADEWVLACRGEGATQFPYGTSYQPSACNVFREEHPGRVLHGNFSFDLLDPRMNLVTSGGQPLLRPTGATRACVSRWGRDGVYDMVGNLDEWVEAPEATFVGGFYARATRNGCEAKVTSHAEMYLDYSTGGRCCETAE